MEVNKDIVKEKAKEKAIALWEKMDVNSVLLVILILVTVFKGTGSQ